MAPIGEDWWNTILSSHPVIGIACDARSITLSYAGVPDGHCLEIALTGITAANDPLAVMPDRVLRIATLLGDGNNDHVVTAADEEWPFGLPGLFPHRWDYNVDGLLGVMDGIIVRMNLTHTATCFP